MRNGPIIAVAGACLGGLIGDVFKQGRIASMKILRFIDDRIGTLDKAGQVVDISDLIGHRAERGPQRVGPDDKRTRRRIIL